MIIDLWPIKLAKLRVCVGVTTYLHMFESDLLLTSLIYPAGVSIAGCSKYPLTEEDMTMCSLTTRMLMYNPWHNEKEVCVIRRNKPPPSPT